MKLYELIESSDVSDTIVNTPLLKWNLPTSKEDFDSGEYGFDMYRFDSHVELIQDAFNAMNEDDPLNLKVLVKQTIKAMERDRQALIDRISEVTGMSSSEAARTETVRIYDRVIDEYRERDDWVYDDVIGQLVDADDRDIDRQERKDKEIRSMFHTSFGDSPERARGGAYHESKK